MRIIAISGLALLTAAASAAPPVAPVSKLKPICEHPRASLAGAATPAPGIHPLDQEPPARQIKAVVRTIDGCNKPIEINAKVGNPPRR